MQPIVIPNQIANEEQATINQSHCNESSSVLNAEPK